MVVTSIGRPAEEHPMNVRTHYGDAYLVIETINGVGQTTKVVGFLLAGVVIVAGLATANSLGAVALLAGFFFGALVALPLYALGVLISAQGQILKASVDTAVNTSQLVTRDELRQILASLQGSADRQSQPRASIANPSLASGPSATSSGVKPKPESEPWQKPFCYHCGADVPVGSKICSSCNGQL